MSTIYIEKHDPAQNIARFYRIEIVPSLFGEWAVMREWGRIGQDGQVRALWFDSEAEARLAGDALHRKKKRRGYRVRPCAAGRASCRCDK